MKKALVHDWYYVNGGAEKVIHSLNNIWNDFDHYSLIDFLSDFDREFILNGKKVNTSFIQNIPTAKNNHRKFLPLFPYAIEQFDLTQYDLVISSSASIAKGVLTNHNQLHICYCHSPMRYAWDFYHQYINEAHLDKGVKGFIAKYFLHKIRLWDVINSNRVDYFIANSKYISNRIKKIYNREATVIYPPVDVEKFEFGKNKEDYYITASRLVSYKKTDLIVHAFNEMPNRKLIVAGDGPEMKKIKKIAKNNIEIKGFINASELNFLMKKAKAFVYAAEEDFGIVPVEAQACGTPVIGFGKGGVLETVLNKETGVLFTEQSIKSIKVAVNHFETLSFSAEKIRENALRFSKERFESEMFSFVNEKFKDFKENN